MPSPRKIVLLRVWKADIYGYVSVEDAGTGIAADVKEYIFEPLVTTKKDGLGLGLSISRSIIQAHGGKIECSASALGGAKFQLSLPLDGERR
jgi:two-component system sensor kinase FixL